MKAQQGVHLMKGRCFFPAAASRLCLVKRPCQKAARSDSTKSTAQKHPQHILLPALAASCPRSCSCLCLAPGPPLPPKPSRLEPRNPTHCMTGSIHPGSVPLASSQDQSSGRESRWTTVIQPYINQKKAEVVSDRGPGKTEKHQD